MKREELLYLRSELQKEIAKRERIRELLKDARVKELITLTSTNYNKFMREDYELLLKLLKDYKITNTNNIYVATSAYYPYHVPCRGFNDDYDYCYVSINSDEAVCRTYTNVEDGQMVKAWISEQAYDRRIITTDFEKENTVLNPYNTSKNRNGYNEVRKYFLENAIKYGQSKSKKLLLRKYPKL